MSFACCGTQVQQPQIFGGKALLLPVCIGLVLGVAASPAIGGPREVPASIFRPSMDTTGFLGVDSAITIGAWQMDGGVVADYALNPLVLRLSEEQGGQELSLVAHRVTTHVVGSVGLLPWLDVGVALPGVVYQERDQQALNKVGAFVGVPLAVRGVGDLELRAKVRVARARDAQVDVAFLPAVRLPTATARDAFFGEAGAVLAPAFVFSRDLGALRTLANVGVQIRSQPSALGQLRLQDEVTWRAAACYDLGIVPVDIGVSGFGAMPIQDAWTGIHQVQLEVQAGVVWRPLGGVEISVGGGVGVGAGYATPDARALLGVRFFEHDTDGDGVRGASDRCEHEPEDLDGFEDLDGCPDVDNDTDGILDATDKCPTESGPGTGDGCPVRDMDLDGVADAVDTCMNAAGRATAGGCPDADSDGVEDAKDACPDEPDPRSSDAESDGCPAELLVEVLKGAPVFAEKIYFAPGSVTPNEAGLKSLDKIARALKRNKRYQKLRVEGHTDTRGKAKENRVLAEQRAVAVVSYLSRAGIDATRLEAIGYSSDRPAAPNDTPENMALNRRVVFVLLEASTPP